MVNTKLTRTLLCFYLSFSLLIPFCSALSHHPDDIISYEDYYSTLLDEYYKYGCEVELISCNKDATYTRSELANQLALIRNAQTQKAEQNQIRLQEQFGNIPNEQLPATPRSIMPIPFSYSETFTINDSTGVCYVNIRLRCSGEVNADNHNVLGVLSCDLTERQSLNLKSLTLNEPEYRTNYLHGYGSAPGYVSVLVTGSARFSWTDKYGSTFQDNVPIEEAHGFHAYSFAI